MSIMKYQLFILCGVISTEHGTHAVCSLGVRFQGLRVHDCVRCVIFLTYSMHKRGATSTMCPLFKEIKFSGHNIVRLDLSYRRKTIKNSNIWRLNNTLLNNQQITEEIKKEIKICIEMNENESTTTQNLWDTVKAMLMGKFIAIQAYLTKQEKSQINNLTLHLKQLEKEEMKNPRVSRRKEILKIRGEINAKETKETIAKINKTKSLVL